VVSDGAEYHIYVDELIGMLWSTNAGCHISDVFIGYIMYADDLILLSPCTLSTTCVQYRVVSLILFSML